MSDIIYKVIFKGTESDQEELLTLTFNSIFSEKPFNVSPHYISTIKRLSEKNQNIINFQNIEEVIKIGEGSILYSYNYYIVILYIMKSNMKKEGFLIGNAKKFGDILIGIWPFNENISSLTSEIIVKKFDFLINHPKDFENICIIYS